MTNSSPTVSITPVLSYCCLVSPMNTQKGVGCGSDGASTRWESLQCMSVHVCCTRSAVLVTCTLGAFGANTKNNTMANTRKKALQNPTLFAGEACKRGVRRGCSVGGDDAMMDVRSLASNVAANTNGNPN